MVWAAGKWYAALVLLILPFATVASMLGLSLWWGTHTIFLSDALNYYEFEPWPAWILRYALWQVTFAGVFSFKLRMFGKTLRWLAYLNLFACLATQISGFSQFTPAVSNWQWPVHITCAMVLSGTFAWETLVLWARGPAAIGFGVVMATYVLIFPFTHLDIIPDTGIPFIHDQVGIPLQWAMLAVHLYQVFANYERVQKEGFPPARCCGRLVTELRSEGENDAAKSLRSEGSVLAPVAAETDARASPV